MVEGLERLSGVCGIFECHKAEASRVTSVGIFDDAATTDSAVLSEVLLEVFFSGFVREVGDIQVTSVLILGLLGRF